MLGGAFRRWDTGRIAPVVSLAPRQAKPLRPVAVQGMVWVMVCWGAYAHVTSGGGDRAMAVSGSCRIMPPQ